ncbi:MAG: hypothetical protein ACR2P6_09185 [Gammaproteobacteria bacterium]
MTASRNSGRRSLLLLALLFFGPLAAAMFLYYSDVGWRPAATVERGLLLQPAVQLPETTLGEAQPPSEVLQLRGRWGLLYVAAEDCDALCQDALTTMRQVRLALGKDMGRIMRVLFVPQASPALASLFEEHPGITVSPRSESADLQDLIGTPLAGELFISDPQGNLVMRFPPGTSIEDIHADLKHLLKLSRIG